MRKIIKVIHVVNLKSYGGIQKLALELTSLLNTQDSVENHLLATQQVDLLKKHLPSNVEVTHIGEKPSYSLFKQALNVFRGYDIIHFHGPFTFFQLVAIFSKKKVVYTEHGTMQKANVKSTFKHLLQKRMIGKYFLEKHVDMVIFISKWIQKDLALKNKNQIVVYNGLQYQEPVISEEKDFVLSIAARLVPKKRVHLAVDLMKTLKDHPSIKLKIIGDGPEMESLKERSGELLDHSIQFLGYKPDAYNIIASSDIYLMTTDMEVFGLVVLEAMMSQTLVLALKDSGGPAEILKDGFSNLILDDIESLSKAVLYWKNNLHEKEQVQKRLKELYFNEYTLDHMAKNYLKVYQNLIQGNR